jgi:hypothetical protein
MFGPDFKAIAPVPFGNMLREPAKPARPVQTTRAAYLGKVNRKRYLRLERASECLEAIPGEGEEIQMICSGHFDMAELVTILMDRLGSPCSEMYVGTLSLARRNIPEVLSWLDGGAVQRLSLLVSNYWSKVDREIFQELALELGQRHQRLAACRSHAKPYLIATEDGRHFVMRGSGNMRSNNSIEEASLCRDAAFYQWWRAWFEEMFTHAEGA